MSSHPVEEDKKRNLRSRAHSRLTGDMTQGSAGASASAALGVLHELASSPATASDALALLHELQVHQVELDMQAEELRGTRSELEAALIRQIQLYDFSPVGLFTVDSGTVLHEVNLTGACMLGVERDALVGQYLDQFFEIPSRRALHTMLVDAGEVPALGQTCQLKLTGCTSASSGSITQGPPQAPRFVQASVHIDPAGQHFLVALAAVSPPASP